MPELPVIVDVRVVGVCSVVFLAGFHLLFLKIWRPGFLAWKAIDYVWIMVGAISLFTYVSQSRKMVADNLSPTMAQRVEWSYEHFLSTVKVLSSPAICRQFADTTGRSDLARIQREFDEVCQYGRTLVAKLPAIEPKDSSSLPWLDAPSVHEPDLVEKLRLVSDARNWYVQRREEYRDLQAVGRKTDYEAMATLLAPYLLSFAISLRISKVTAEIANGWRAGAKGVSL